MIEFIGISGSGKSTLCQCSAALLDRNGYSVRLVRGFGGTHGRLDRLCSQAIRVYRASRTATLAPSVAKGAVMMLRFARLERDKGFGLSQYVYWLGLMDVARLALKQPGILTMMDQGPVQYMASMARYSADVEVFFETLANSPAKYLALPTTVIHVDVDIEEAAYRFVQREGDRVNDHLRRTGFGDVRTLLEWSIKIVDYQKQLCQRLGVKVVTVPNGGQRLTANTELIVSMLR